MASNLADVITTIVLHNVLRNTHYVHIKIRKFTIIGMTSVGILSRAIPFATLAERSNIPPILIPRYSSFFPLSVILSACSLAMLKLANFLEVLVVAPRGRISTLFLFHPRSACHQVFTNDRIPSDLLFMSWSNDTRNRSSVSFG